MNRHDVRMCETCGRFDFLEKSLGAERGGHFGIQNFYGDAAAVPGIERAVNGGHPASTDHPVEGVPAGHHPGSRRVDHSLQLADIRGERPARAAA